MNKKLDPQLLTFAKSMCHTATDAENMMWQVLRAKHFMNLKFHRQHVIKPYIVDFYCHEIGLVIELDGSQHGSDDAIEYDAERTKFLQDLGLTVVRYLNHDVLGRTDEGGIYNGKELEAPLPNPHLRFVLKQCFKTCSGEGTPL